jgi:hypothetical protein
MSANHGTAAPTGLPGGGSNSCNLYYQDPNLSASAAESLDLTLIGQQDSQPLTPDEVIVVKVSPATLGDSLVYRSEWTGPKTTTAGVEGSDGVNGSAQSYPTVVFRPKVLVEGATSDNNSSSALGRFLALDPAAKAQYEFMDDSGDNSLWTLQSYFANTPFVFTNPLLAQIPAESVKSVTVTKISTKPLTAGANARLGATNFTAAGGNPIMSDYIASSTGSGTEPAANDYALDLFQQADAAGKVAYWQVVTGASGTTGSTTASPASSSLGLGDVAQFSQVKFVEGDSITVYVTYNMIKTKTFHLDAPSALGGPGTAQFKLTAADGSVISVSDGVSMESQPASVVVAYQFMASNSPIYQFGFNFSQCFASINGSGGIGNFNVAWRPVEGAQSYKLFFAARSDVNPTSNSGDPNALTHSISNPTPYFYASTSAIAGNSYTVSPQEFFNPLREHESVNVFVYAYSDSNASVRITNGLPSTYLFIAVDVDNERAAVQIWESTYLGNDHSEYSLKNRTLCDNAPLLAKLTR